jgi:hypothetical protein
MAIFQLNSAGVGAIVLAMISFQVLIRSTCAWLSQIVDAPQRLPDFT